MREESEGKYFVGLTGPLGAGKSVVGRIWEDLGAGLVIGDIMGVWALLLDENVRHRLVERFGGQILKSDGSLDRAALAKVAFAALEGQRDLTAITFPTLYRLAKDEMATLSLICDTVVFDAALIYEWGVEKDFDLIVVVTAPRDMLIERVLERGGLSYSEIIARLDSQIPAEFKVARADRVIFNDGSLEDLTSQAEAMWQEIVKLARIKYKAAQKSAD